MGPSREGAQPDPLARLEADLALQAASILAAESDVERAERVRAHVAAVPLVDRLRGAERGPVRLLLLGGAVCAGVLVDVGSDHVQVVGGDSRRTFVRLEVVLAVPGLGRHHRTPGRVAAAWSLAAALRRLAADRSQVEITAVDGSRLQGTVRSVGADHVDLDNDLVAGDPAPLRVDGARRQPVTVALAAVATVRCGPGPAPGVVPW